jgi:hypothetical protein
MDEDFEKALQCKKDLQASTVEQQLKKKLIIELLSRDLGDQLSDK